MKQLFTTLLLFALFISASDIQAQSNKTWTLLIYLDGSDLETTGNAGTNDLAEMTAAGNTSNINVIVTTGGSKKDGWREIKRFKIENGVQIPIPFTASSNAMSNPQNLTDFINWGIENYPADNYMIDLWNHGMSIRGYAHDENTDAQLKVPQIKSAIGNTNFIQGGKRFEVIGFDACLMSTIEVQSSLVSFGNYFVGSEETEPGHGWNYTPFIKALQDGSATNGEVLGRIIADAFKAQATASESANITLSVTNLSQIPPLVTALEDLMNTIKNNGQTGIASLQKARAKAEEYSKSVQNPEQSEDVVDIGDLMKQLKKADPNLASQADAVLTALTNAVTHTVKDKTRPKSTGITMFIPHNQLKLPGAVDFTLEENYDPLSFSPSIKNFIGKDYVAGASSDQSAPGGSEYNWDDEEGGLKGHQPQVKAKNNNAITSSILVHDTRDLEQVQVVLLGTSFLGENEVELLGSTFPDTCRDFGDGSKAYAYVWDELWLGINGYPAYIADIFEYEADNEAGLNTLYTRVKIPAILTRKGDTSEQDIILSYVYDDAFNIQLESIVPESYGDAVLLTAKERVNLNPGDKVQLLYEGFNNVTGEDFDVVNDDAVFTIETGNSDLHLEHDFLEEGDYILGYRLTDFSQNDTIIYDTRTYSISTSTVETFAANNIELFPNPSNKQISIIYKEFSGKEYQVQIYDARGRLAYTNSFNQSLATLGTANLPTGYYVVKLITKDKIFSDKLIIQR